MKLDLALWQSQEPSCPSTSTLGKSQAVQAISLPFNVPTRNGYKRENKDNQNRASTNDNRDESHKISQEMKCK